MIIRLLVVIAALCLASAANAQNVWTVPATACIPAETAIGNYKSTVASVRHETNAVGSIVFNCQMDRFNSGTTTWNLRIMYRDSTGTNGEAYVVARLYRMAIGTTTPVLVTQINSNTSANTAVYNLASPEFDHTFDFEANAYWVRIELNRAYTDQVVIFYSVVLDGTQF